MNEYLKHANDFFSAYDMEKRIETGNPHHARQTVYLATDEKKVYKEAKEKRVYPGFSLLMTVILNSSSCLISFAGTNLGYSFSEIL